MPTELGNTLPQSQMQHFTATQSYTLGYTRPNNEDLGFDKANGAAYIIQSRFRVRKRRKEWLSSRELSSSTMNNIVSQAKRRRRHEEPTAALRPTTWRGKMWALFNDPSSSLAAYILAIVILIVICFSCCVFVLQTLPALYARHEDMFWSLEAGCVMIFTAEFAGRVFSCPDLHKFVSDFLNWIDLLAIVPFYIEEAFKSGGGAGGLATLRLVRLARVFRLFKLGKNSKLVGVFAGTLRQSVRPMITMCMFVVCGVVIIASIMYYTERGRFACACHLMENPKHSHACGLGSINNESSPERFLDNQKWNLEHCVTDDEVGYWLTKATGDWERSPFQDIPSACYFALVTMTTVGYGDVAPKSAIGQAFASMFCVFGVVIIALPISVISANFKKNFFELENDKKEGIGMSGGADPKALSLRKINESSENSLDNLMDMYQREDAAALLRVRLSSHTSMSSWMPPDWVRHMSGKYDEPPKIEPTSSASMLGRGSGKLLMSSSTTMSSSDPPMVTCTPPRSDGGLGGRNPNPRNAILEEGETLEPEPEPMPLP